MLDFSVAKMDTPDAQLTRAGTVFGTPRYMSPEQARGVKLSPQSDVYACGIVLYEMLTGKPPFEATADGSGDDALAAKPAPLVGFEPIVRVVNKALERRQIVASRAPTSFIARPSNVWIRCSPKQTPSAGMSAVTDAQRVLGMQAPTVPPQQNYAASATRRRDFVWFGSAPGHRRRWPPPMAPPTMAHLERRRWRHRKDRSLGAQRHHRSRRGGANGRCSRPRRRTFRNPGGFGGGGPGRTQGMDGSHATMFVAGPAGGMTLTPQALALRQRILRSQAAANRVALPKPLFWELGAGHVVWLSLHIIWN